MSMLGNEADAHEVCQEAFTRAFIAIPKLQQISVFYPWFYRILKNLCLNLVKRRKLERGKLLDPGLVLREETQSVEPIQNLELTEEQGQVREILKELKPAFREILVLKHFSGLSYDEIAERLKIPRGSVMSRLFHARKQFKARYAALQKGLGRGGNIHEKLS